MYIVHLHVCKCIAIWRPMAVSAISSAYHNHSTSRTRSRSICISITKVVYYFYDSSYFYIATVVYTLYFYF